MKKSLLGAILMGGLAAGVYAQGTISVDNISNVDPSSAATTGGLVFTNNNGNVGLWNGSLALNVQVLGGSSSSSLTPVPGATLTGGKIIWAGPGLLYDSSGATYSVTGVALSGNAALEILAWTGNFSTYLLAQASGTSLFGDTGVFTNPTGGGGTPPALPTDFIGMPALFLSSSIVPEPSTLALAGLGAAAMLAIRRRK